MPCQKKQPPPPPPNADKINPELRPIDKNCGPVSFRWVKPVAKKIKERGGMYFCDVHPLSDELRSKYSGKQIITQWNSIMEEHEKKLKKNPKARPKGMISMIRRACKKNFGVLFLTVPLSTLCGICSPISVRQFTGALTPATFYDCDQLFNANPQFQVYDYKDGLVRILENLWGYLILVLASYIIQAMTQNISFHNMGRVMIKSMTGLVDILYQKILLISDQSRSNAAAGNIVNLLFTDTTKICMLINFIPMILQVPLDFIAYIIYLGVQINPIALCGLLVILILIPLLVIILKNIVYIQKKSMGIRDIRVKRATEILNGIKVIKLFSLEKVQQARLSNTRQKELAMLFKFQICMSFLALVASATAPLMTSISFIALTFTNQFDIASAFTTMFLYQYLSFTIIMLPMFMSFISEASISSARIQTFLNLSEKEPGVVVMVNQLNGEQINKMADKIDVQTEAIKVTGKPSFTWQLAEDKVMPPLLDPFFKENMANMSYITKNHDKVLNRYNKLLLKSGLNNKLIDNLDEDERQVLLKIQDAPDDNIVEKWCVSLDLPSVARLSSLEQYNYVNYQLDVKDSMATKLKKQYIHVKTMEHYIAKNSSAQLQDSPVVLKNIDMTVKKGEVIGICAQVGQGKTSLFNALLGEMRIARDQRGKLDTYGAQGNNRITFDYFDAEDQAEDPRFDDEVPHVYINGAVSYFAQSPAILSKSVRDNIIFGKPYDDEKYKRIVNICCLVDDFKILANGDQTVIGGKGVTLSGGQKARVALARAVYADADIVMLDDPLSAVDAHVGKTIWEEVIMGYLKAQGKTVIIASHQTQFFGDCDRVMQLADCEIKYFDTPENVIQQGAKILGLTSETSTHRENSQSGTSSLPTQVKATMQLQEVTGGTGNKENTIKTEQQAGTGDVKCDVYKKWCASGSKAIGIIMIFALVINQAVQQYQTVLVTHWSSDYYGWTQQQNTNPSMEISCNSSGDFWCMDPIGFMQYAMVQNINMPQSDMVQAFSKCYVERGATFEITSPSSNNYLWLYFGLTFALMLFSFIANLSLTGFCISISRTLHNRMIGSILRTKMAFFDTTPQGRILNRMSKDIDAVDNSVVRFAQQVISTAIMIIGMVISIAVLNYPCLIVIIPCLIIFFGVLISFKRVYPQVKRLEAVSRSPVFNLCQETIDCLITIRAFGTSELLAGELRQAIDINGTLFYQQFAIMRWMTFKLNLLTSFFAFFICVVAVLLAPADQNIASYTGVIVSQAFSITQILFQFVITFVNLEGEMSSVERVLEYQDMPAEGVFERSDVTLKDSWPENNSGIEVRHLKFRYRPELDLVLKDLSFSLKPKEHIGIVGRTGAGKSSITVAMYRLAEPDKDSQIIVDGVDILSLGLHQARRAFTIIPQDPFLFSGTLRQCLCPYSQAEAEGVKTDGLTRLTDEQIWRALDQVQMRQYFENQPGKLDSKIALNGDNLSAGQKQLVCVARALVRNASCVILDEATACVDRENDRLIQDTIRNAFADVTVLSIAHRLDTIIDFDRIIVMDAGRVAEFDTPANLLRNEDGIFTKLVNNTGVEVSERLRRAAFQAEEQRSRGERVQVDLE